MAFLKDNLFAPAVFSRSKGFTRVQILAAAKTLRDAYEQDSFQRVHSLLSSISEGGRSRFLDAFERACVTDLKVASRYDWLVQHRIGGDFLSGYEFRGRFVKSPFVVTLQKGQSSRELNSEFYPNMRIKMGEWSSWYLNRDGRVIPPNLVGVWSRQF